MGTNDITPDRVRELLRYEPETGRFFWLVGGRGWRAGKPAGSASHGYVRVGIDGTQIYAHRLAWLCVHGCWPARDIDHINGNGSDNRICNLREATPSQNLANAKGWRNNTCGHRGVHRHCDGRWRAQIKVGDQKIHIGLYASPEEAGEAYQIAASRYFGEFARGNHAPSQGGA